MSKKTYLGQEADDKVFAGAEKLYNAVRVTLGPKGKNFMVAKRYMAPFLTHDGVTVASHISLDDKAEEVGAEFIRQAARKSAANVGDGTTSTTILTYALLKEYRNIVANPMVLARELNEEAKLLCEQLKPLDTIDLKAVATLSAADATIGGVVDTALSGVGIDGSVVIEESNDDEITVEFTEGFKLKSGYLSSYMINTDTGKSRLDDVPVIIFNDKLEDVTRLNTVLQQTDKLCVVANEFTREVIARISMLNQGGKFQILGIKSPELGARRVAILEDLCSILGAKLVTDTFDTSYLGKAQQVVADRDYTIFVGTQDEKRLAQVKQELNSAQTERDIDFIKERIANIEGKVAVITVGGSNEAETKERYFRVEDAIAAGRAALESGVVAGGATTYLSLKTSDSLAGELFSKALEYPFKQLMQNAGLNDIEKREFVTTPGQGVDVMNPDEPVNLVERGIIEPLALVEAVIKTAASIAGSLITMGGLVVEEDDNEA